MKKCLVLFNISDGSLTLLGELLDNEILPKDTEEIRFYEGMIINYQEANYDSKNYLIEIGNGHIYKYKSFRIYK